MITPNTILAELQIVVSGIAKHLPSGFIDVKSKEKLGKEIIEFWESRNNRTECLMEITDVLYYVAKSRYNELITGNEAWKNIQDVISIYLRDFSEYKGEYSFNEIHEVVELAKQVMILKYYIRRTTGIKDHENEYTIVESFLNTNSVVFSHYDPARDSWDQFISKYGKYQILTSQSNRLLATTNPENLSLMMCYVLLNKPHFFYIIYPERTEEVLCKTNSI